MTQLAEAATPRWRTPLVVVLAFAAALVALFVVQFVRNYDPYNAGSPSLRVTVAGGCPQSLGPAVDVSNPGPSWWHALWSRSRLASSGADSGLVCVYASGALKAHKVMSADQASAVSAAAHAASTKHASGKFNCPSSIPGAVAIVVLGYQGSADMDIWWNYTGCQSADNGHVQAVELGEFPSAVSAVAPGAPLPG